MTSLTDLMQDGLRVKLLGVGEPKTGKTGSLAALINTGRYKFRVIDLDGHFQQSVRPYIDPSKTGLVDVWSFDQELRLASSNSAVVTTIGRPELIGRLFEIAKVWKYKDRDGKEIDLGPLKDWDSNTILVVDPLSEINDAAMQHTLFVRERLDSGPLRKEWGLASALEDGWIKGLLSKYRRHHVIMFAHTKLIGPEELPDEPRRPSESHKATVEALIEKNKFMSWRRVPRAVAREESLNLARLFNVVVSYETQVKGLSVERIIRCEPNEEFLTAVPALNVPKTLPAATGLVWLFDAVTGRGKPTTTVATETKE